MINQDKIVVLDGHTLNPGDLSWAPLETLGQVTLYDRTGTDEEQIIKRAQGVKFLLTNKTPVSASVISNLPDLEYIGVLATGFNVVDIPAATEAGITVTNIPTYGTDSVAQMAFAHILHFCHHLKEHSDLVIAGNWSQSQDFCFWNFPLVELAEKTIGIIGFGRIGRKIGSIAHAFGMKVIAHDLYQDNAPEWDWFEWGSIEDILVSSDFISLNCPLTAENTGMINRDTLRKMKKSAFLVNVSRGPLMIDHDLAQALNEGIIAGAGIDVLGIEPPDADNPLFSAKNLSITPHIAWATKEARNRLLNTAVENVRAFLNKTPINTVNEVYT